MNNSHRRSSRSRNDFVQTYHFYLYGALCSWIEQNFARGPEVGLHPFADETGGGMRMGEKNYSERDESGLASLWIATVRVSREKNV